MILSIFEFSYTLQLHDHKTNCKKVPKKQSFLIEISNFSKKELMNTIIKIRCLDLFALRNLIAYYFIFIFHIIVFETTYLIKKIEIIQIINYKFQIFFNLFIYHNNDFLVSLFLLIILYFLSFFNLLFCNSQQTTSKGFWC